MIAIPFMIYIMYKFSQMFCFPQKLPSINRDLFERLIEDKQEKNKKKVKSAETLLKDDRFSNLFSSADFQIDKDSVEYQ